MGRPAAAVALIALLAAAVQTSAFASTKKTNVPPVVEVEKADKTSR
jgi:hypothetical protein